MNSWAFWDNRLTAEKLKSNAELWILFWLANHVVWLDRR